MQAQDETLSDVEIALDEGRFLRCRFERCKLVYRGGALPTITDCNFQDCRWHFDEAAERTLLFMRMLYHGMGSNGPALVEPTFEMIRAPFPA